MTDLAVRDVLIRARARIEDPQHWTQGWQARDKFGSPVPTRSRRAVRWCPIGAVNVESGVDAGRCIEDGPARLASFNDKPGRTHAEVLALFDRAIEVVS